MSVTTSSLVIVVAWGDRCWLLAPCSQCLPDVVGCFWYLVMHLVHINQYMTEAQDVCLDLQA
jgi:hypothetical protein